MWISAWLIGSNDYRICGFEKKTQLYKHQYEIFYAKVI